MFLYIVTVTRFGHALANMAFSDVVMDKTVSFDHFAAIFRRKATFSNRIWHLMREIDFLARDNGKYL